jgi:hypothetical protein
MAVSYVAALDSTAAAEKAHLDERCGGHDMRALTEAEPSALVHDERPLAS